MMGDFYSLLLALGEAEDYLRPKKGVFELKLYSNFVDFDSTCEECNFKTTILATATVFKRLLGRHLRT